MRRARQAIRRKCSRRQWLSYCAYIAQNPRAKHFFTLVGVPHYGIRFTARLAWEVATANMLPRTNFRPLPTRSYYDDLPF